MFYPPVAQKRLATTAPTNPRAAQLIPNPMFIQFYGGCVTATERALLRPGTFSMVQNMRNKIPGLKQRGGQIKLHTVADSTNKVLSLFQFSKGKKTERKFYAQMSDGDILEATTEVPGVTSGAFGSEVFSGSTGQVPASWSVLDDVLFHSNGADQHKIYPGVETYVDRFIVYKGTGAIPVIPKNGEDYSYEVSDGLTTTAAILDSLGDLAVDYDCIFIKTLVPAKQFNFVISKPNGTESVGDINYWKNTGEWTDLAITDGTSSGGATIAQNGSMAFTAPTDIAPHYLFGECGFWYQFHLDSGDLDAEVEITSVTYEADFQSIANVWDGIAKDAIEVQLYTKATDTYKTFASSSIAIGGMVADPAGADDWIYFSSADPIVGFYVDVGDTPNVNASTLYQVNYWTGSAFANVSNTNDGSDGIGKPGWVTFARQTDVQATQFNDSKYHAYWYRFSVSTANISSDVIISIQTMPYFDINDIGTKGNTCCAWKERMAYTFSEFPQYIYVTAAGMPLTLNGSDFALLKAGDGRSNKIVAMVNFFQELMVFQEEKGTKGGCITMFQGNRPSNFGKLLLSAKIGTFSAKSVCVVEGVLTQTQTGPKFKTLAFFISHHGVMMADGLDTIKTISDDIQNYFDPKEDECIRRGYESEMFITHDSSDNTLLVGLVSGSTATTPNIFPVYDLKTQTWSFDVRGQELSCAAEVESGSGNIPIRQVGGGVDDGTVYLLNDGTNDVQTPIDAFVIPEFSYPGLLIESREAALRIKVQDAGEITITSYRNEIAGKKIIKDMAPVIANQTIRRHRIPELQLEATELLSLKFQNDLESQELYLFDLAVWLNANETQ
jgi:hypothetical protein